MDPGPQPRPARRLVPQGDDSTWDVAVDGKEGDGGPLPRSTANAAPPPRTARRHYRASEAGHIDSSARGSGDWPLDWPNHRRGTGDSRADPRPPLVRAATRGQRKLHSSADLRGNGRSGTRIPLDGTDLATNRGGRGAGLWGRSLSWRGLAETEQGQASLLAAWGASRACSAPLSPPRDRWRTPRSCRFSARRRGPTHADPVRCGGRIARGVDPISREDPRVPGSCAAPPPSGPTDRPRDSILDSASASRRKWFLRVPADQPWLASGSSPSGPPTANVRGQRAISSP